MPEWDELQVELVAIAAATGAFKAYVLDVWDNFVVLGSRMDDWSWRGVPSLTRSLRILLNQRLVSRAVPGPLHALSPEVLLSGQGVVSRTT